MKHIDEKWARRIAARLRASGDTPAAELIEALLEEAKKPKVTFVKAPPIELDWEL